MHACHTGRLCKSSLSFQIKQKKKRTKQTTTVGCFGNKLCKSGGECQIDISVESWLDVNSRKTFFFFLSPSSAQVETWKKPPFRKFTYPQPPTRHAQRVVKCFQLDFIGRTRCGDLTLRLPHMSRLLPVIKPDFPEPVEDLVVVLWLTWKHEGLLTAAVWVENQCQSCRSDRHVFPTFQKKGKKCFRSTKAATAEGF